MVEHIKLFAHIFDKTSRRNAETINCAKKKKKKRNNVCKQLLIKKIINQGDFQYKKQFLRMNLLLTQTFLDMENNFLN